MCPRTQGENVGRAGNWGERKAMAEGEGAGSKRRRGENNYILLSSVMQWMSCTCSGMRRAIAKFYFTIKFSELRRADGRDDGSRVLFAPLLKTNLRGRWRQKLLELNSTIVRRVVWPESQLWPENPVWHATCDTSTRVLVPRRTGMLWMLDTSPRRRDRLAFSATKL